jgi:predicted transcriptional regulator of viral defense system
VNPFLVAGKLSPDAVVAFYGALQFHRYVRTSRSEYQFLTGQPCRPFRFGSCNYVAVAVPKILRVAGQESFGVTETRSEGTAIRVTNVERTFVDVLDRPWDEPRPNGSSSQ